MLWMESVDSARDHIQKTATSTTANRIVEPMYGTRNSTCRTSAAIVPKTATIATAKAVRPGSVPLDAKLQHHRDQRDHEPPTTARYGLTS